jgi:hypothetical protein
MSDLDNGRTVSRQGVPTQSSLRVNSDTRVLQNLDKTYLGIVLRVYYSDDAKNPQSGRVSDRRSSRAVCDVLITQDGRNAPYWVATNVVIPPSAPSGLDDFEEQLPRSCNKYINGDTYDTGNINGDTSDLDGDWAVVSFIGGDYSQAYVSNWWPHPRNIFDPQTSGKGNPTTEGVPRSLTQQANGNSRYLKRTNGVELVINGMGDVFFSTHYAGSALDPQPDGVQTNGRFHRTDGTGPGGGVRINIKKSQPLELFWGQEDGIGLNNVFDPSLPQTNPTSGTPFSIEALSGTYIRCTDNSIYLRPLSGFSVETGVIHLSATRYSDILVGTNLSLTVGDEANILVSNSIDIESTRGDIFISAEEGLLSLFSETDTTVDANTRILLGANASAETESVILGTTYTSVLATLVLAMEAVAAAVSPAVGLTFTNAANAWRAASTAALSTKVFIEPNV